jgi:hypothetical protein
MQTLQIVPVLVVLEVLEVEVEVEVAEETMDKGRF